MQGNSTYQELLPFNKLALFVDSFWNHINLADEPQSMTIVPDSYFKIVFLVKENQPVNYFLTGLWTENKEFSIPPKAMSFGCRFKILAPEFLIQEELAPFLNSIKQLDLSFLNIRSFPYNDFHSLVDLWEKELQQVLPEKEIPGNKKRLSDLLYDKKGEISVSEVEDQIYWSSRQINRYLNKWLGVSLKTYLNMQKCYQSYLHIRKGEMQPQKDYHDQSHFIKEVKKHTGETPSTLFEEQNDRFIQLKNIKEK